jgi:GNAT superfamily N-acetyltransferase
LFAANLGIRIERADILTGNTEGTDENKTLSGRRAVHEHHRLVVVQAVSGDVRYDFAAVEDIEFEASIDLFRAAPRDVRAAHAIEVRDIGPATCLSSRGIEPTAMFRRVVRLGAGRAVSEAGLDDVLDYMNERGLRYAVPVAPQSQPSALASWLEKRGFTPGYAWMKFCRPCEGAPQAACDLEVRVIGSETGGEFGRVVAEGFGLPPAVAPWVATLAGRANWVCVMAFAGGTPVAAGAVYVSGEHAWLGLGATLASHRRRGAQAALLARRLGEAAARGAHVAVTETGERLPDKPSHSYRNILRAGFEETYLRQNYMSPSTTES